MPSDSSWDFGPVLDLIDSDSTLVDSPAHRPRTKLYEGASDSPVVTKRADTTTPTLGSFAKLWESLGIKIEQPFSPAITANTHFSKDVPSILPKNVAQSSSNVNVRIIDDAKARRSLNQRGASGPEGPNVNTPTRGLSKNARKKANRIQETEKKFQEEQAKLDEQREALKERFVRAAYSPKTPQLDTGDAIEHFNLRSRSNVGAKVKSITPPPVDHGIPIQPSCAPSAQPVLFDPTSTALQSRLASEIKSASIPPIANTERPKQSKLGNDEPHTSYQSDQSTQQNVLNRFDSRALPSSGSFGRPGAITPSTKSVLAHINAGLQTQYTTGGIPYTYLAPSHGGFQTPLNAYSIAENVSNLAPIHPMHHRPVPSLVQHLPRADKAIKPEGTLPTREDRNIEFFQRVIARFPEDKQWLGALMPYKPRDNLSSDAIHVFIDASNILIGFNQTRSMAGFPRCDMSFDGLAFLLERRRPVAKRIYSGSTRCSAPIASNEKFNALAGDVGYEKNIFEQVLKTKELTERQKFFRDVDRLGYSKAIHMRHSGGSGGSSDSETGASPSKAYTLPTPKWVEQGVDESLHLKMCQSIIDCDIPSTMVLATGDGAEAEYSDGFLSHVERALKNGWKVELVSWRQQTNSGYKSKRFRAKWGDRFRIIELDEFMEFLVDT